MRMFLHISHVKTKYFDMKSGTKLEFDPEHFLEEHLR